MPVSDTPRATFAANVIRLREERQMTQEQLGWAAGLHQTAVALVENGERAPTFDTILKLATGLEAPPSRLFEGIG